MENANNSKLIKEARKKNETNLSTTIERRIREKAVKIILVD